MAKKKRPKRLGLPRIAQQYSGRRTRLNKALLDKIRDTLSVVVFEKYCYGALDIPMSTWEYWKAKGREVRERVEARERPKTKREQEDWAIYLEFLEIVETARPKAISTTVGNLRTMARNNYRANICFLRAVDPETWSEADSVHIQGTIGVTIDDLMKKAKEHEGEEYGNGGGTKK